MEYSCEENNKSLWEGRIKAPEHVKLSLALVGLALAGICLAERLGSGVRR